MLKELLILIQNIPVATNIETTLKLEYFTKPKMIIIDHQDFVASYQEIFKKQFSFTSIDKDDVMYMYIYGENLVDLFYDE